MGMTLLDRSNYFKGMLLLIGKDKRTTVEEREMLMRIGKLVDFEPGFCQENIDKVLINDFIIDGPVEFSTPGVAKTFIKDGLKVAFADDTLHLLELRWLYEVVEINHLSNEWFAFQMTRLLSQPTELQDLTFELEKENILEEVLQ